MRRLSCALAWMISPIYAPRARRAPARGRLCGRTRRPPPPTIPTSGGPQLTPIPSIADGVPHHERSTRAFHRGSASAQGGRDKYTEVPPQGRDNRMCAVHERPQVILDRRNRARVRVHPAPGGVGDGVAGGGERWTPPPPSTSSPRTARVTGSAAWRRRQLQRRRRLPPPQLQLRRRLGP